MVHLTFKNHIETRNTHPSSNPSQINSPHRQIYDQFAKEGKVDGANWIAKEDPPVEYIDVLESSTDKAPTPVME
jgi:hypothetical protein